MERKSFSTKLFCRSKLAKASFNYMNSFEHGTNFAKTKAKFHERK